MVDSYLIFLFSQVLCALLYSSTSDLETLGIVGIDRLTSTR